METNRNTNLVDCFRILAACCIVLFHLGYFQYLSANQQSFVIFLQQLFASWALPFFYVVTARFSLASSLKSTTFKKLGLRVGSILRLMITFTFFATILYLANHFLIQNEGLIFLDSTTLEQTLQFALTTNPTPNIFLFHVILISFCSYFISLFAKNELFKNALLGVCVLCLLGVLVFWSNTNFQFLYSLGISHTMLIGTLVGYAYALANLKIKPFTIWLRTVWFINLLLIPLFLVGMPLVFFAKTLLVEKFFLTVFSFAILFASDFFREIKSSFLVHLLSNAGRKYSLGIFVVHPLVAKVVESIFTLVNQLVLELNQSLFIFLTLYLVIVAISFYISFTIKKWRLLTLTKKLNFLPRLNLTSNYFK